jgi:hypothetical protein
VQSGTRVLIQNLFQKFWTFLQVSTNFGSLNYFLPVKTIGKTINKHHTVSGRKPATACGVRVKMVRGRRYGGLPCVGTGRVP